MNEWLEEQAGDGEAEAVEIQRVDPPADLSGGDAAAGLETFNGSCAVCHGEGATGTMLAPQLAGTNLTPEYIATRVRTSGQAASEVYEGLTGGLMPFWGLDRLSDDELLDVVAWVSTSEAPDVEPDPDPDPDPEPLEPGDCPSTHPKVGQTAVLVNHFHDIAGIATIVNDCTIEIEDFGFDGNGIDVRMWAGPTANLKAGFPLGENLKNFPTGYEGDTIMGELPEDKTLDDVESVSIWCVPVGVSFGDGVFE